MVRKVYARDVKTGANVSTVFKVEGKERHTAKSGKVFLALTLVDKTGRIDGRIFDNVDAAEAAFQNDDYLLVTGKAAVFHGKPQVVIERLEKLDPGPIDAQEFTYVEREKPEAAPAPVAGGKASKQLRQRLLNLLDDPAVAQGLEALVRHLERYVDERVEQRLSGGGEKRERPPRPPRPEREREKDREREEKKAEPHKTGLPKDLAFKPFSALAPETPAETAPEASPTTPGGS